MKPALLALFLAAVATLPAAPFEGRINLQRATVPDEPHDLIYRVKGDRNRVEVMRDRVTTFLTDTTTRKTTVILEDDMAYLILPSFEASRDGPILEKTGEKAALLGYPVQNTSSGPTRARPSSGSPRASENTRASARASRSRPGTSRAWTYHCRPTRRHGNGP